MQGSTPTGFSAHADFALAYGYTGWDDARHQKNRVEIIGEQMGYLPREIVDKTLRNLRNPLMHVATTMIALAIVTLAYYPRESREFVAKVFPAVRRIEPWMIKGAIYLAANTTVAGLGLRAFGRFSNDSLVQAWKSGEIMPIRIGTRR